MGKDKPKKIVKDIVAEYISLNRVYNESCLETMKNM